MNMKDQIISEAGTGGIMNFKELYEKTIKRAGQGITLSDDRKERYIQKRLIENAYMIGVNVGLSDKEKIDKLLEKFDSEEE